MDTRLQIIIAVLIVIGVVYIVNLIRKNRLELKYALSWFAVAAIVLVMDCFPALMEALSELLGIASPVNMIFFMGFLFSLLIILTLTVAVSIAAGSVKRLNQKIALLEKRLEKLEDSEEN